MERKGCAVRPHQGDPVAWNRPRRAGLDGGRGDVHTGIRRLCRGPPREHLPAQVFLWGHCAHLLPGTGRGRVGLFIPRLGENQCCGAYGPEDWDLNVYFNCSGASYSREKCGVPFSCCVPDPAQKVVNTQCGYDVRIQLKSKWDEFIFTKGCIQALEGWLPRNIYIVAGVFIAISLLQIFGIFLARTLISDIEAVKAGHHF
ncbi:tetraspanin 14, isoform CRA_b [Mus musculus]|nr:tetraspanin 14, isoform CRA_b [Mus musculus]